MKIVPPIEDFMVKELFRHEAVRKQFISDVYTDELFVGQHYEKLKKCVSISILNFNLLEGENNHNVYTLRDKTGRELTDLFEVHIIELQKQIKGENPVNDWVRLFNAREDEDLGY